MASSMKVDMRKFQEALAAFPAETTDMMTGALRRSGLKFEKTIVKERLSGRPGLMNRSGAGGIRGSIIVRPIVNKDKGLNLIVGIGGRAAPYARVHELGAGDGGKLPSIKPKNKKWLAFPFPGGPADKRNPLRPSDWRSLSFIKAKKPGTAYLFGPRSKSVKKARGGKTVPVFLLKKEVNIPARLEFVKTWNRDIPVRIKEIRNAMRRISREVFRG